MNSTAPAGWTIYTALAAPGQVPVGPRRPLAFTSFLYFEPAHQALQQLPQAVMSFFLEADALGLTLAQLFVVLDAAPGQASSPGRATFGGVQLAAEVPAEVLDYFVSEAEHHLRAHQQRALTIGQYALCYDPVGGERLAAVLAQRGYAVALAEANYHLDLTRAYEANLHPSARRRLAQCRRRGLAWQQEPPALLPAVYEFVAACRAERQQPTLSLPLPRLQALFASFPQQHLLLTVREPGGQWAAATVAIRASERVLHNFYPASPLAYNALSPAILLTAGLCEVGRAANATVLDLGRSTLHGREPHESLLRFKRHLGGVASPKLTWHRPLQ